MENTGAPRYRPLAVAALLLLGACRHPLTILGEGDITSASGDRDCLLEQYQAADPACTDNSVRDDYVETYFAVPRPGWHFAAWGNYCPGVQPADQCRFEIDGESAAQWDLDSAPPLQAYFRRDVSSSHSAVLMGHSFFRPFAQQLPIDAVAAGFSGHQQQFFSASGAGGAPIALWENDGPVRDSIMAALDAGGMTLFGMTYYPDSFNHALQGYINWIDYALRNNSDFAVFIGLPWGQQPALWDARTYKRDWVRFEEQTIHPLIDALRQRYPQLEFYCIPYGMAGVELKRRFEAGQLTDVASLIGPPGGALFVDSNGHAGDLLVRAGSLIWLRAIYAVDPASFDYASPYTLDLGALANRVMNRHDHRYDAR